MAILSATTYQCFAVSTLSISVSKLQDTFTCEMEVSI